MERTAYNLLKDGKGVAAIKGILRERFRITNARWAESAINQAKSVLAAQEARMSYQIELYKEKMNNETRKMELLSDLVKVWGCNKRIERLRAKSEELRMQLRDGSYPRAVFGSSRLLHQLRVSDDPGRRKELRAQWRERRSNHFFSVGQANCKGNANMRLGHRKSGSFWVELRNWPEGDYTIPLVVPDHWREMLGYVTEKADSFRRGNNTKVSRTGEGLAYSVRVIRSRHGYQVLVSFELDDPPVVWTGKVAGIDINPTCIGCTIVSEDGNLVVSRFFKDRCFITASRNKRKWILEDTVNRMLRWCRDTCGCNVVATEELTFIGAHDSSPQTNFKLSNFMKRKMLEKIGLGALKMGMLNVGVNPAYTSKVATAKYSRRFGGFNRHQLAAFVIARRALGYGEAPAVDCLPKTRKERTMWNHCIRYYGHQPRIQTLPRREPIEWKSVGDVNGGTVMTELLTAPPAITPSQMGLGHLPEDEVGAHRIANGEWRGSVQMVKPTKGMELEGIELTLPTHEIVGQRLSSAAVKIAPPANS